MPPRGLENGVDEDVADGGALGRYGECCDCAGLDIALHDHAAGLGLGYFHPHGLLSAADCDLNVECGTSAETAAFDLQVGKDRGQKTGVMFAIVGDVLVDPIGGIADVTLFLEMNGGHGLSPAEVLCC